MSIIENETFQVRIDALKAIQDILEDKVTAELAGVSKAFIGKAVKDWDRKNKEIFRKIATRSYISITFLHSDSVFFVNAQDRSYVVPFRNKVEIFCMKINKNEDNNDFFEDRVEFVIYARLIDELWYFTAAFRKALNSDPIGKLEILADWPIFTTEDEVYENLNFKVTRDDLGEATLDEFGEYEYGLPGVEYKKNGIQFRV